MKSHSSLVFRAAALATAIAAASLLSAPVTARAQFVPGNLVLDRLGDGTQTLANTGNSVFLDQYSPAGTLVNTVPIPSSGAAGTLIQSGTATSEGALSLTQDRSAIVFAGYNVAVGSQTTSISSASSALVPRGIGEVSALGTYSFVAQTTAFSGNNIRTATGTSPTGNFYAGGGNSGTVLLPFGASGSAGTAIQTTNANTRVNNIFNNTLYYSKGAELVFRRAVLVVAGQPGKVAAGSGADAEEGDVGVLVLRPRLGRREQSGGGGEEEGEKSARVHG
jgi:hypothetical protein